MLNYEILQQGGQSTEEKFDLSFQSEEEGFVFPMWITESLSDLRDLYVPVQ